MPIYKSKVLENYILIEFQKGEDKTAERVLERDDYWRKMKEDCWRAPYSMERASFARDFCRNPQKYLEITSNEEILRAKRKRQLYEVLEEQEIEYFVHFTNAKNLENIFKYGLLSVRDMKNKEIEFIHNDKERLDNKLGAICLSVSFPNYRMFSKYRYSSECDWVVLLIAPKQILELNCKFCVTNAASRKMRRRISINPAFDFKNMFSENMLTKSREMSRLPKNFTTDPQAEILVMDSIPINAIQGVCFQNEDALMKYNYLLQDRRIKIYVDETYFDKRIDHMYWGN